MTTEFDHLSEQEKTLLFKAPAMVAVYAAMYDDGIVDEKEKADAIRLAHLRTFTSPEALHSYYEKVDTEFEQNFDAVIDELPSEKEERDEFLEKRLKEIGKILAKVETEFADDLARSLKSFSRHVFKANSHFLEYFLLPGVINHIDKAIFSAD